ncbi:uncharacterized protein LOC134196686 isoform X2 [Corticium candelabrum]|nr:uncharacterized protein LOC134196686 isoform X2 [Corticium candelabrum]
MMVKAHTSLFATFTLFQFILTDTDARPNNAQSAAGQASDKRCKCECPSSKNSQPHRNYHNHHHNKPHEQLFQSPREVMLHDQDSKYNINISMPVVQSILSQSTNSLISLNGDYTVMTHSLQPKMYTDEYSLLTSNVSVSWQDQYGQPLSLTFQVYYYSPLGDMTATSNQNDAKDSNSTSHS